MSLNELKLCVYHQYMKLCITGVQFHEIQALKK